MSGKQLLLTFLFIILVGIIKVWSQESENIIRNSEFDDGKRCWVIKDYNNANATIDVSSEGLLSGTNCLVVNITCGGQNKDDIQLYQSCSLEKGYYYHLSLIAMASVPHQISAVFQQAAGAKEIIWTSPEMALSPTPQRLGPFPLRYLLEDATYRFVIFLGGLDNVTVHLDSIVVAKTDDPEHFRTDEKFEKRAHTFQGTTLPYRLCPPDGFNPAEKYPLVLALHGAGERGTDNEIQIKLHRLAFAWSDSANQKKWPCFVVAPQCPEDQRWVDHDWSTGSYSVDQTPISNELATVNNLLDSLIQEFPLDTNRFYVTGLSMGGYGTWDLIARFPHRFAAAIPMSGGGDSTAVSRFSHLPLWVFHGEKDTVVPVAGSRDMVAALERLGLAVVYTHCKYGDCEGLADSVIAQKIKDGAKLLYTEWPGKDHVMWAESYDYPYLLPWVFSQSRDPNFSVQVATPAPTKLPIELYPNYPNPFNPTTQIKYRLDVSASVKLDIFNARGQWIQSLVNQTQPAGSFTVAWDGRQANGVPVASGVFIYKLQIRRQHQHFETTRKMLLMR